MTLADSGFLYIGSQTPRIPHDRPAAGCGADARSAARRPRLRRAVERLSRPAARSDRLRRVRLFARRLWPIVAGQDCRARSAICTTRRARRCRFCSTTIGFQRGLLIGHSDGASIAAIYAGSHQDHRVGGLVLMAPHFFTEDMGIASIEEARKAYETGDLRRAWRAGMPTSTMPSRAGTAPGSIPVSATGISPSSSPISACPC